MTDGVHIEGRILIEQAQAAIDAGRIDEAATLLADALRIAVEASDLRARTVIRTNLGRVAYRKGRVALSKAYYRLAERDALGSGDGEYAAKAVFNLGLVRLRGEGDPDGAERDFQQAIERGRRNGQVPEVVRSAEAGLEEARTNRVDRLLRRSHLAAAPAARVRTLLEARRIAAGVSDRRVAWVVADRLACDYNGRCAFGLAARFAMEAHGIATSAGLPVHASIAAAKCALSRLAGKQHAEALIVLGTTALAAIEPDGCEDAATYVTHLRPLTQVESPAALVAVLELRLEAFATLGLLLRADITREAIVALAPGSESAVRAMRDDGVLPWPADQVCRCGVSLEESLFCCTPEHRIEIEPEALQPGMRVICEHTGACHDGFNCDACGRSYSWEAGIVDSVGRAGPTDDMLSDLERAFSGGAATLCEGRWWEALSRLAPLATDHRPALVNTCDPRGEITSHVRSGLHLAAWAALGEVLFERGCDRAARWLAEESLAHGLWFLERGEVARAVPDATRALMVLAFNEGDIATVLGLAQGLFVETTDEGSWQGPLGLFMATAALDSYAHALIRSTEPDELRIALLSAAAAHAANPQLPPLSFPAVFYEVALADAMACEGRRDGEALDLYGRALLIDPAAIEPLSFHPCESDALNGLRERLHARLSETRLEIDLARIERQLRR